jgi:DNA primase
MRAKPASRNGQNNYPPDRLTTSAALTARDGRLYVDYLSSGRGTAAVATYPKIDRLNQAACEVPKWWSE